MLVGNAKPSSKIVAARPQTYRQILHGKPQTRRGANPKNDVGGWQTPNPERGWETLTLCWVARPINPTRKRRLADPTTAKCGADSQALIGFKPALSVFRIDCLNRLPLNRPARLARIVLLNPGIVSEPCYSLFSTYRGTGDSKGPAMSAGLSGCRVQGCFRSPNLLPKASDKSPRLWACSARQASAAPARILPDTPVLLGVSRYTSQRRPIEHRTHGRGATCA